MANTVMITEAQLNAIVRRCVNEAIDEGLWDGIKGMANVGRKTMNNYYQGNAQAQNGKAAQIQQQIAQLQQQKGTVAQQAAQQATAKID